MPTATQDSLLALYQGWIDSVLAFGAAAITGAFSVPSSRAEAASRETALREWQLLDARIAKVRTAARNERQIARRAELNMELACLRDKRRAVSEVVGEPQTMKKITVGDPVTRSADTVVENRQRLKSLFPEAFTEGNVDFDVLASASRRLRGRKR